MQAPAWQRDGMYLLAPGGGLGDRLDTDSQSSKHPDWSADGTTVVYASDTDGQAKFVGRGRGISSVAGSPASGAVMSGWL
jgi:Tol biopolymer transport system component